MSVCPYRHSVGYSSGCPCSRFSVHSIGQLFSHSAVRSSVQASGHTFSPASIQSSDCPLVRLFSRLTV
ncbi:hypothetical protein NXW01_19695 [Parabacteroides distasonis]|uniref:hypothetical protein n=1 Tax=Parabacteroides distasonis TaxID=823 RepID=UPI002162A12D|nr:hypothetical protein [Parabacteroides distasonis]UVP02653.1 hypothetical protein NXW01_19695 [Parabacteroides distasonis]